MSTSGERVTIYTDGACSGNPGPGGWGAVLVYRGRERELFGGEAHTTNNRMELMAVIKALQALRRSCHVNLVTDSKYVMRGLTEWLPGWKRRGWRTAAKKAVKNQDLWEQLDVESSKHEIAWQWVRGHAGHAGNERADVLARAGIEKASLSA